MDDVVSRVRDLVAEERVCRSSDPLIVGVSGGADSVCLLDVLAAVRPRRGRRLVVLHVDHGFRPDSASDATFVRELAEKLGLQYEVARFDGVRYARRHRLGLEHAGRALRYQALSAAAARHGARFIATGHTQDDSIENVLMRLIRGTGIEGLRGIAAREELDPRQLGPPALDDVPASANVVRPLLAARRAETAAYCERRGLPWRVDPTNEDPGFLRNRVRHHLLPVLRTYNPRIDAALSRMAALLRDEAEWLDAAVARRSKRFLKVRPGEVEIEIAALRRERLAVQRRLVRRAAAALAVVGDGLGFEAVERAVAFAQADEPRRLQLAHGLWLTRLAGRLRFTRHGQCEEGHQAP